MREVKEVKLKAWDNDKKEWVKFGVGKHTYGYGQHCVPEFRTSEDDEMLILPTSLYYSRDWNITWFIVEEESNLAIEKQSV